MRLLGELLTGALTPPGRPTEAFSYSQASATSTPKSRAASLQKLLVEGQLLPKVEKSPSRGLDVQV